MCDGCARAKATQKRTNKVTTVVAEKPGKRIYMDRTKQGSHGIFMEQERMA